jgi:membrane protein implicated in regulation of membrane protease activity
MAWWIWIVLGAALLVTEVVLSTDFWLVFFGVAALGLGLLGVAGLVLPAWAQFLVFALLSVLGL